MCASQSCRRPYFCQTLHQLGAAQALTQTLRLVCLFTPLTPSQPLHTTLPQVAGLGSGIWLTFHKICQLLSCIGKAGCHSIFFGDIQSIFLSLSKLLLPCSLWLSHSPHYMLSLIFLTSCCDSKCKQLWLPITDCYILGTSSHFRLKTAGKPIDCTQYKFNTKLRMRGGGVFFPSNTMHCPIKDSWKLLRMPSRGFQKTPIFEIQRVPYLIPF